MMDNRLERRIEDDNGKEHPYRVSLFPSSEGFDLLPLIIQLASGPIGDLIDAIGEGGEGQINGDKLGNAVGGLASAIIAQGSSEFLKRILKYATRGDQKVPAGFDAIYQGNYGELFAAVAWVLEVNFAPFLKRYLGKSDIGGLKGLLMQKLNA